MTNDLVLGSKNVKNNLLQTFLCYDPDNGNYKYQLCKQVVSYQKNSIKKYIYNLNVYDKKYW